MQIVKDRAAAKRLSLASGVSAAFAAAMTLGCADLALRQVARHRLLPTDSAGLVALAVIALALIGVLRAAARRVPSTHDRMVALLLVAAFAGGLYEQQQLGARLQSDGFYYFAYLRSIWFDHDVDFTNDYRLLGLGDKAHLFQPTPTGHAQSAWTIGPAIVWSPFFAGGDAIAHALASRGKEVATDGTSFPYRQAVCVAGLFYGLLGVWFCYRLAALFFPRPLAAVSAALTTAGSFMLWYLVKEPSMTHAPSMAAVAAFTYFWAATRHGVVTAASPASSRENGRSLVQWLLLGLVAGLATTIRWQNAIFALLPAIEVVQVAVPAWRRRDTFTVRHLIIGGLLFTAGSVVGFVPQMLAWKSIYGSYLAVSPVGPAILWSNPAIANILWSSRNGLFATSPILYAAALGLLAFPRIDRRFALAALVTIAVMVYFNATILDWWGSAGFGMRRFDGIIPLMTVGLALFLRGFTRLVAGHPRVVAAAAMAILVLWNLSFMSAALSGAVRIGEATSFSDLAGYQARAVERWVGYPFSYPANLAYAAQNGVSPDRYDWLAPGAFLGDPRRPYGRVDVGVSDEVMLEDGWWTPEQEGTTTYRWSRASSTILVPLDHAENLQVQVRVKPFGYPGGQAQSLTVRINGTAHGPFALQAGWQDVRFDTTKGEWRRGVNRAALQFSWEQAPSQVGAGNDPRPLSAAVDYLRIRDESAK